MSGSHLRVAAEPISLFARIADPAAVARLLRERAPGVVFEGSDGSWRRAVITVGKLWNKRKLTITHDPSYYAEPRWSIQMNGMRGYFSRFPDGDRKNRVMGLTTTFRFSLGTLFDPERDSDADPRLNVLFAVAELLDGVFFTPTSLRDAHGRILFAADAEDIDPNAVWPKVIAEVSIADPAGPATHEPSSPDSEEDDDEVEEAPTAERVARRALALAAVTARAILERDAANPEALRIHEDLQAWVRDAGLEEELEPDELQAVQQPLGRLDSRTQANLAWRLEGLAVLAWALRRFEIPPYDELVSMDALWQSVGLLDVDASKALLAAPTLRSRDEIERLRGQLFALHWRLRDFQLNGRGKDFAEFARTAWFGPLDLTTLRLIEGDLDIAGNRIDRAPKDAIAPVQSAAQERHQAANWLWEGPDCYADASVAT